MPKICIGAISAEVPAFTNLLVGLERAGVALPSSCRAGQCQACLVKCNKGHIEHDGPSALNEQLYAEGWRLACQCRVTEDVTLEPFDPQRSALPASITALDWLGESVLRLRLLPKRVLRYVPGQAVVIWHQQLARTYSMASVPERQPWLEFHIDCAKPGRFVEAAKTFYLGQTLYLGALRVGALHYDPVWQSDPLYLMASGTGLAPLWAVVQEALALGHQGPIFVHHLARTAAQHYLRTSLESLSKNHPNLHLHWLLPATLTRDMAALTLASRQSHALLCGSSRALECFSKRLYLAGLPRSRLYIEQFTPAACINAQDD